MELVPKIGCLLTLIVALQHLSHDEAVNNAYMKDPLVKQMGTLKGVGDMLDRVCNKVSAKLPGMYLTG